MMTLNLQPKAGPGADVADTGEDAGRRCCRGHGPAATAANGSRNVSQTRDVGAFLFARRLWHHNDHGHVHQRRGSARSITDVDIVFVDWGENVIGRTSISFADLGEFETKRFYGHVKWDWELCPLQDAIGFRASCPRSPSPAGGTRRTCASLLPTLPARRRTRPQRRQTFWNPACTWHTRHCAHTLQATF